ncbi:MAG: pantoate--beta-alanine ligase [Akkermansiaceae bacterium]|nr:pantoate--beta-alanine ligase [Akkermansiaceae bacterium]
MTIISHPSDLRLQAAAATGPRVLVPTMGALHAGHLVLIRRARELAGPDGTVMVSIFVNPIQFDRVADLAAYPQPLEADLAACREAGVDLVFTPAPGTMYHPDRSVTVTESSLSQSLCGASRPGHFDGVCTVVLKLFLLSGCGLAVFGEKDFQQLAIIRRMVRDLDLPVTIVAHPTLREPDGLALSSRNVRLTPAQRAAAPQLRQSLLAAKTRLATGIREVSELLETARMEIESSPLARIDYLSLVDAETLQPVTRIERPAVLAAAVFYGEVRLIDHVGIAP